MSQKRNKKAKFPLVFFLGISVALVFCSSAAEAAARNDFSYTCSYISIGFMPSLTNIDGIAYMCGTSSQKTTDKELESKKDKDGKSDKKDLNNHKNSTSRRRFIIVD